MTRLLPARSILKLSRNSEEEEEEEEDSDLSKLIGVISNDLEK